MNLIEAYANLDNESKKTQKRLDEKIPRDLANAMKKRGDWSISAERHGIEPIGENEWEDFENNEYNEITPEEALKLKKQGKADKIKALVNGQYVDFWDSGDVRTKSGYVRNSFGTLVKNADKLYFVDDSKSNANEKRAQRYKDNSLDVYTGDSWNPVQTVPIDRNTGDHDAGDSWAKYKVARAKEYIDMYKKDLKELESLWDDGEISRKEYDRRKKNYQDEIAEEEETIKKYGPQTKNRNYDDRYNADAWRMQSRLRRFQDVKDIPAERNVEDSRKNLEKAEKDYPEKIARKEAEIAKLQAEIDALKADRNNDKSYVSAFNDLKNAEARLDKKKKELADIKSGKWSVDNLKTESLKRKNRRPLKEADEHDQYYAREKQRIEEFAHEIPFEGLFDYIKDLTGINDLSFEMDFWKDRWGTVHPMFHSQNLVDRVGFLKLIFKEIEVSCNNASISTGKKWNEIDYSQDYPLHYYCTVGFSYNHPGGGSNGKDFMWAMYDEQNGWQFEVNE